MTLSLKWSSTECRAIPGVLLYISSDSEMVSEVCVLRSSGEMA